jgi:hypothetical protein
MSTITIYFRDSTGQDIAGPLAVSVPEGLKYAEARKAIISQIVAAVVGDDGEGLAEQCLRGLGR